MDVFVVVVVVVCCCRSHPEWRQLFVCFLVFLHQVVLLLFPSCLLLLLLLFFSVFCFGHTGDGLHAFSGQKPYEKVYKFMKELDSTVTLCGCQTFKSCLVAAILPSYASPSPHSPGPAKSLSGGGSAVKQSSGALTTCSARLSAAQAVDCLVQ